MARNGDETPARTDDSFRHIAVSRLPVDNEQVRGQPKCRNGRRHGRRNDSDPGGRTDGRMLMINQVGR